MSPTISSRSALTPFWRTLSTLDLKPREWKLFAQLMTMLEPQRHTPVNAAVIARNLGLHEKTVLATLRTLCRKGVLEKAAERRGHQRCYRLSADLPWPAATSAEQKDTATDLPLYDLDRVRDENHTAVIGETGSGKSLLTKYLIGRYFRQADVQVYDCDATPHDWPGLPVIGRKGRFYQIAVAMQRDLEDLWHRTSLRGDGEPFDGELVRVIEEYPATADELRSVIEDDPDVFKRTLAMDWLRGFLRRGRKLKMKIFAVAQEFEVSAWKIDGEGGLRKAFTVFYLGASAYEALSHVKDKEYREKLQRFFDTQERPCLVDNKGRYFATRIPDLSVWEAEAGNSGAGNQYEAVQHQNALNDNESAPLTPFLAGKSSAVAPLAPRQSYPDPLADTITLPVRQAVLTAKQQGLNQQKTILAVWGVTKGSNRRFAAARERYREILREAGLGAK